MKAPLMVVNAIVTKVYLFTYRGVWEDFVINLVYLFKQEIIHSL